MNYWTAIPIGTFPAGETKMKWIISFQHKIPYIDHELLKMKWIIPIQHKIPYIDHKLLKIKWIIPIQHKHTT